MMYIITTQAQIVINEFSASNSTQIEDTDYANWIKLYNTGSTTINTQGYYLTDNSSSPNL